MCLKYTGNKFLFSECPLTSQWSFHFLLLVLSLGLCLFFFSDPFWFSLLLPLFCSTPYQRVFYRFSFIFFIYKLSLILFFFNSSIVITLLVHPLTVPYPIPPTCLQEDVATPPHQTSPLPRASSLLRVGCIFSLRPEPAVLCTISGRGLIPASVCCLVNGSVSERPQGLG